MNNKKHKDSFSKDSFSKDSFSKVSRSPNYAGYVFPEGHFQSEVSIDH
jgi:hypothetical protein